MNYWPGSDLFDLLKIFGIFFFIHDLELDFDPRLGLGLVLCLSIDVNGPLNEKFDPSVNDWLI